MLNDKNENKMLAKKSAPLYVSADELLPELDVPLADVKGQSLSKISIDRRDLLRMFSITAVAGASACVRRPAEKAIPYVNQPIDSIPGVPMYYASTCGACSAGCGIVVKTREGRPVKVEGNSGHLINDGKLCASGQAQIQGLYHPERLSSPMKRSGTEWSKSTWDEAYQSIASSIGSTEKIGILTSGSSGHSREFYRDVLKKMGSQESRLYTWESQPLFATMARAHKLAFGKEDLPRVLWSKVKFTLGVGTDFLDVGTSSVYNSLGFSRSHSFNGQEMGTFEQFESHLTLTGARADKRHVIPPDSELLTLFLLIRSLFEHRASKGSNKERVSIAQILSDNLEQLNQGYAALNISRDIFDDIAIRLLDQPSVVLAGSSEQGESATQVQLAAIMANILLGSYGETLSLDKGWLPSPVEVDSLGRLVDEIDDLDVLFVVHADPIFTLPKNFALREKIKKVKTLITINDFPSETDRFAHLTLPAHHFLETWGDDQPLAGFWSIRQPAVRPITDSRQAEDMFLWVLAHAQKNLPYADYRAYLLEKWQKLHKLHGQNDSFEEFHHNVLKRGFVGRVSSRPKSEMKDLRAQFTPVSMPTSGLKLLAPLDSRLGDGRYAHLPTLQEIGDGLTTIAWDTWISMNPETVQKMGLQNYEKVKVQGQTGGWFEAAIYAMPGLHADAVVVNRGNGHEDTRCKVTYLNGANPLDALSGSVEKETAYPITAGEKIKLVGSGERFRFAMMQKKNDIDYTRTDIYKKVSVEQARTLSRKKSLDDVPDLFPKLEVAEHRWGLSVDLSKCNGCGACMAACALENNVPQVGRDQIIMGREMHWIRLDRYFSGDLSNPTVNFQPVMCQQCNHAPCEAVCPVFATTHDPEGINSMTYNRCVGTRYCANACPYKVRRFNWWTYKWGSIDKNPRNRNPHALNPDVTVRTKGIMEKCNFCQQRLREARHKAKEEERQLRDGEALTACQQTCPAEAISFGNLNDPYSQITKDRDDPRAFLMLGGDPDHEHYGVKTLPNVSYLKEVVHKLEKTEGHH